MVRRKLFLLLALVVALAVCAPAMAEIYEFTVCDWFSWDNMPEKGEDTEVRYDYTPYYDAKGNVRGFLMTGDKVKRLAVDRVIAYVEIKNASGNFTPVNPVWTSGMHVWADALR